MRKRASRPNRFAAVENTAIDALPSVLATGLLTKLIRARDGEDVTVEGLCKTHVEGREALTKAMRMLVEKAFVVKFKLQRAASEMVEEDGELVAKRGGSWYTTFSVDSFAFTAEDVSAMLAEIYDGGNVKSHRIEPEHLDPNKNGAGWSRPGAGIPSVGATRENAEPWPEGDSRPTYGSPTVGPPTVGHPAAHIRKKTVLSETKSEDGMPLSGRSPVDGRSPSSTGSRAAGDEGGSAASGKTQRSPSTKKAAAGGKRHSRAERATVEQVLAFLPPELPVDQVRLPVVADAILSAMAADGRSVEEMGQRILYRWLHHGFAEKVAAGQLRNPVGTVVALVRPLRRGDKYACADAGCENGRVKVTGVEEDCRLCAVRIADWKAAQQRNRPPSGEKPPVPPQRAPVAPSKPLLEDCTGPYCTRSVRAGRALCDDCQEKQEAAAAGADLVGQWDMEDARRAEQQAAAVQVDAEDARLRAEFAAQNPGLAAYSSDAPF